MKTTALTTSSTKSIIAMIALLLTFQAIDWFAPKPETVDITMMVGALISYSVVTLIAWWLSKTRSIIDDL